MTGLEQQVEQMPGAAAVVENAASSSEEGSHPPENTAPIHECEILIRIARGVVPESGHELWRPSELRILRHAWSPASGRAQRSPVSSGRHARECAASVDLHDRAAASEPTRQGQRSHSEAPGRSDEQLFSPMGVISVRRSEATKLASLPSDPVGIGRRGAEVRRRPQASVAP